MNTTDLQKIQKESAEQGLPEQKKVLSASDKLRRKTSNLPDPTHPPMGWQDGKGYDHIFPWVHLPRFHPTGGNDTVIFNAPDKPANQLILGDNLEVLRTLKTESVDLIYIDPPFFSGRNYNVIWGDTNEVRSFLDVWEGGMDSYLVWLNARLWEMLRILKKLGSIYVHCDWHASHYIKTEMDKIFGYGRDAGNQIEPGFRNEISWCYAGGGTPKGEYPRKHDVIFWYTAGNKWTFNTKYRPYSEGTQQRGRTQIKGIYFEKGLREEGTPINDWWTDVKKITSPTDPEKIGYPTQKSEELLQRIIEVGSNQGDVIADFFCGGGTTLAVAQKLARRFIGCDSSRVAISVTLDRLVKVGEEMSGIKSNVSAGQGDVKQTKLETHADKVPNIEVSYLGVYPIEKFAGTPQENFVDFVLTCYGASKNTAEGQTHGFRPPGQSEPILVGPANPNESVSGKEVKAFFDELKSRLEPNKLVSAKIIGWRFSREVAAYVRTLEQYIYKHSLPLKIELIALDSRAFRARVLQRYPDVGDADFLLRFSKAPVIGEIKIKKVGEHEYEFEAVDAFSTNEDGWLVNCQWDFDYQEGHFAADNEYILSREKAKDKKNGEHFTAVLKAKHTFVQSGEVTVACKVQDNLAGESIIHRKLVVKA